MTKISLTKIPKLPMPNKFQSITIRVTGVMRIRNKIVYVCELYGIEDGIYQLTPTDAMQRSLTNDFWTKDKYIDDTNFENIEGHILTIRGIDADFSRKTKNGEVFKPKVYEFHLRDDIECMQTHGQKEKLETAKLNIIKENKDVINNKIKDEHGGQ